MVLKCVEAHLWAHSYLLPVIGGEPGGQFYAVTVNIGCQNIGSQKKASISLGTISSLEFRSDVGCQLFIQNSFWQESGRLQTLTSSRFLKVQKVTSSPQNISEGPISPNFGDSKILAVSNTRVVYSCWVRYLAGTLGTKSRGFSLVWRSILGLLIPEVLRCTAACQISKEKYWMCLRSISKPFNKWTIL